MCANTILLIEHDAGAAVSLVAHLRDQGFRPLHAADGHQGLRWARAAQPHLVLLNATLPQIDGFTACSALRGESTVPIIMLGPNHGDVVRGLEAGADDYLVRPFDVQELVARVHALLRRCELERRQIAPSDDRIAVGNLVLNRATQQVRRAGHTIEMPQREFDVLRVLMENAGQAVPRRQLLDQVWGEGWIGYPRTLNVHIYRLRKKLDDDPANPRYIETVRGYGYRFIASGERAGQG